MASLFFTVLFTQNLIRGNPVPLFSHEVVNARRLCHTKPKWGEPQTPITK